MVIYQVEKFYCSVVKHDLIDKLENIIFMEAEDWVVGRGVFKEMLSNKHLYYWALHKQPRNHLIPS